MNKITAAVNKFIAENDEIFVVSLSDKDRRLLIKAYEREFKATLKNKVAQRGERDAEKAFDFIINGVLNSEGVMSILGEHAELLLKNLEEENNE